MRIRDILAGRAGDRDLSRPLNHHQRPLALALYGAAFGAAFVAFVPKLVALWMVWGAAQLDNLARLVSLY